MLSLRAHLVIAALLFAAIPLAAVAAGMIHGLTGDTPAYRTGAIATLGVLAAAFGFAAVPVMVKLVMGTQRALGNDAIPAVRAALSAETMVVWAIWLLMGLGLALAVPAAILDGAFSDTHPVLQREAAE